MSNSRSRTALPGAVSASLSLALLLACSGGGSDAGPFPPETVESGQFFDTVVENLRYEAGARTGYTDASGTFEFVEGDAVIFWVGDIQLPTADAATVVTPVELVPGATDEADPVVTNVARFLLSLDYDGDSSNGIQIDDATHQAAAGWSVDFTNDAEVDAAIAALAPVSTVSDEDAQDHLADTLLCLFAGEWSGTYSSRFSGEDKVLTQRDPNADLGTLGTLADFEGDDGILELSVFDDGEIEGSGQSDFDTVVDAFALEGEVTTDGVVTFGSDEGNIHFEGVLTREGTGEGTWYSTIEGDIDEGKWEATQDATVDCEPPRFPPL
jgi:hypothetical protein